MADRNINIGTRVATLERPFGVEYGLIEGIGANTISVKRQPSSPYSFVASRQLLRKWRIANPKITKQIDKVQKQIDELETKRERLYEQLPEIKL